MNMAAFQDNQMHLKNEGSNYSYNSYLEKSLEQSLSKFKSAKKLMREQWSMVDELGGEDCAIEFMDSVLGGDSKLWVNDFFCTATDSEICAFADSKADLAESSFRAGESLKIYDLLESYGFDIPTKIDSGEVCEARLKCPQWWRRKFRKLARQKVDQIARENGRVRLSAEIYCGNFMHKRRLEQLKRQAETLKKIKATNEEGFETNVFELAGKSVSNKRIRRSELMVRMKGFEVIAGDLRHVGYFFTWTCPSKFHATSEKYNQSTPKEAQEYLCNQWKKCRAKLKRDNLEIYGFRVVEPHGDGTPHWHMLFFMRPFQAKRIIEVMKHYAFEVDGKEAGAFKNRFKAIRVDRKKGSATGYIAKYICKNIDGMYEDSGGNVQTFIDTDSGGKLDSVTSAQKVEAWATGWNVRQFQQIGGAPVGIWRELRKLKESHFKDTQDFFGNVNKALYSDASENLKIAFAAADGGYWDLFIKAMGGINRERKLQEIKILKVDVEGVNYYGEENQKIIKGVIDIKTGKEIITRFHQWQLEFNFDSMSKEKEEKPAPQIPEYNKVILLDFTQKKQNRDQLVLGFQRACAP